MKTVNNKVLLMTTWILVLLGVRQIQAWTIHNLRNRTGAFKSRNYPKEYPRNIHEKWYIRAPLGYRIELTFSDFDLPTCSSWPNINYTTGDFMLISGNQNDIHGPLCGYHEDIFTGYYHSKRNKMSVEFHSDNNNDTIARRGFSCHYRTYKDYFTSSPNYRHVSSSASANSNEGWDPTSTIVVLVVFGLFFSVISAIIFHVKRNRDRALSRQTQGTSNPQTIPDEQRGWTITPDNNEAINPSESRFGDPPPSYLVATRSSLPDVSFTQQSSQVAQSTNEVMDSSGLPSYTEALARQSLTDADNDTRQSSEGMTGCANGAIDSSVQFIPNVFSINQQPSEVTIPSANEAIDSSAQSIPEVLNDIAQESSEGTPASASEMIDSTRLFFCSEESLDIDTTSTCC